MDYPYRGARNQRYVKVQGEVWVYDIAAGESSDVDRVEYGDTATAMSGAEIVVEEGIELATWTDPRTAPVPGYDIVIVAQDATGFWWKVTRWESGEYGVDYGYGGAEADFVWYWEVRGEMA